MRPDLTPEIISQIDPWALCQQPSWTWYADDGVTQMTLFCGGIIEIEPGVVESWAVVNAKLPFMKIRLRLIKELKAFHLEYAHYHDIRRVQCLIDGDYRHAHTLVKWLGYKHEARLEEWGRSGGVKHRYAWLLKDHT